MLSFTVHEECMHGIFFRLTSNIVNYSFAGFAKHVLFSKDGTGETEVESAGG